MNDAEEELDEGTAESEQEDDGRQKNLERCLSCRHSSGGDPEQGTLRCKKHTMLVNATDDEIPDDCKEYEK